MNREAQIDSFPQAGESSPEGTPSVPKISRRTLLGGFIGGLGVALSNPLELASFKLSKTKISPEPSSTRIVALQEKEQSVFQEAPPEMPRLIFKTETGEESEEMNEWVKKWTETVYKLGIPELIETVEMLARDGVPADTPFSDISLNQLRLVLDRETEPPTNLSGGARASAVSITIITTTKNRLIFEWAIQEKVIKMDNLQPNGLIVIFSQQTRAEEWKIIKQILSESINNGDVGKQLNREGYDGKYLGQKILSQQQEMLMAASKNVHNLTKPILSKKDEAGKPLVENDFVSSAK